MFMSKIIKQVESEETSELSTLHPRREDVPVPAHDQIGNI